MLQYAQWLILASQTRIELLANSLRRILPDLYFKGLTVTVECYLSWMGKPAKAAQVFAAHACMPLVAVRKGANKV